MYIYRKHTKYVDKYQLIRPNNVLMDYLDFLGNDTDSTLHLFEDAGLCTD